MKQHVRKWGKRYVVQIPAAVLDAADFQIGDEVRLRAEGGRIIIENAATPHVTLEMLLEGITPENVHDPLNSVPPVGKEVW